VLQQIALSVAELAFPSKSEQPARDEVAGGLLWDW